MNQNNGYSPPWGAQPPQQGQQYQPPQLPQQGYGAPMGQQYQPPQLPQQGYGAPMGQQYQPPPQQGYGQGPPQQGHYAPQQAHRTGFFIPDQSIQQQAYQKAQEARQRGGDFPKLPFFTISGPGGAKWSQAPKGYTGAGAIYLCPAWKAGVPSYVERISHFWKSKQYPQGRSINGGGSPNFIEEAYDLALQQGNKSSWCRPRTKYVYQGWPYAYDLASNTLLGPDPSQCIGVDGQLGTVLFEVSGEVHGQIQEIAATRGWAETFHPDFGRPILVKKTKTGHDLKDVEYKVIDLAQQQLAEPFYSRREYLRELDTLFPPPSVEDQIKAIQDAGLPMPPGIQGQFQGHAQTGWVPHQPPQSISYTQHAAPPGPNPYQQPFSPPAPQMGGWSPPGPKPLPSVQGAPQGHAPMLPPQHYQMPPQQMPPQQSQPYPQMPDMDSDIPF